MKFSILILTLFTLVACSKNKVDKHKDFVIDYDKIRQEQEKLYKEKMQEEIEKSLAENKIKTCEVEEKKPSFLARLKQGIAGRSRSEKFDVVFPKKLTDKIMTEILDSIYVNLSFNPTDFWELLSDDTSKELNRELVNQFLTFDDEKFKEVRNTAAFMFLFYFQLEKREKGYELFLENQDMQVNRIKVAFDDAAKFEERTKLSFCEKISLTNSEFRTVKKYLEPSEIQGQVVCENGPNKVTIEQYTQKTYTAFKLNLADLDEVNFKVGMPRDTLINEYAKNVEMSFLDRGLEIAIERQRNSVGPNKGQYRANTFKKLSLEGEVLGQKIKLKNLKCNEIKSVIYQQD